MPSLDTVVLLLHQYGYLLLFVITVLEGPIIAVVGAFLAAQGFFNIFLVYLIAVAGDMAGDVLYYYIGRFSRVPWVERLAHLAGIRPESFTKLETYFQDHGYKALIIAKYTQTGVIALPAAGVAKMPMIPFLWYNLIGTLPKALIFVLLGYFFGYAYHRIDSLFAQISFIAFVLTIILGGYLYYRSQKKPDVI